MPSEQRVMSPKKGKDVRRPPEHQKMWNVFVVNSYQYVKMIQQFFLPTLQERDMWLQQDGATAQPPGIPWVF
ncbi:hypothetical protein TNCV_1787381 [Trichonephila clavipes]|nr:hypothetical protein TNCV_1787381 [Trichonephila clavipes]